MQPSNNMQPRGSFVKPQEIMKAMEKVEAQKVAPAQPVQPLQPQMPTETPPEKKEPTKEELAQKEEAARLEKVAAIKASIESELEVKLTDEDINAYLFKGILSKEVTILKGKMKGTFTTLRIKEIQEIDTRMAKIRDDSKHTQQGLANEESIIALSYSWTHAAGRPLGTKAEEREAKIRDMAAMFIEAASTCRIRFDTLIRIAINDDSTIKK